MSYSIKQIINIENKINIEDVNNVIFNLLNENNKSNEVIQYLLSLSETNKEMIIEELKSDFKYYMKEVFVEQCTVYPKDYFKTDFIKNGCESFPVIRENIERINYENNGMTKNKLIPVIIKTELGNVEYFKAKDYIKDLDEVCRIEREMFGTVTSISKTSNSITIHGDTSKFGDRLGKTIEQGLKLRLKEEYLNHFDKDVLLERVKDILGQMIEPILEREVKLKEELENENPFKIGVRVNHVKHGEGKIVIDKEGTCHDNEVMVKFDEHLGILKDSAIAGSKLPSPATEKDMYIHTDIMLKKDLKVVEEPSKSIRHGN